MPSTVQAMLKQGKLHSYDMYKPGNGHYDHGTAEVRRDERRLILSAECQVGKTGAYLHYLQLLTRAASVIAVPPPLPPLDEGSWSRDAVSWLLPCWQKLLGEPPLGGNYGKLFASKYTAGVAKKRANLVMQSCKPGEGSWVDRFQNLLQNVSGEAITSKAGKALIAALNKELAAPFNHQGQSTKPPALESLKAAIDWDGRFHSPGVFLCACNGQCTTTCQQATANRSSYGAFPPIIVADLANTGGKYDGVSGRWEVPRLKGRNGENVAPICVTTANLCAQRVQAK